MHAKRKKACRSITPASLKYLVEPYNNYIDSPSGLLGLQLHQLKKINDSPLESQ